MAILSASELGRLVGVSRQASSKWIKDWGIPTLTDEGGKKGVDSNHPDVAAYIANASAQRRTAGRARASTEPAAPSKTRARAKAGQGAPAAAAPTAPAGQTSGRDSLGDGELGGVSAWRGSQNSGGDGHGRGRTKRGEEGEGPTRSDYVARKEKSLAEKHELANRILRHLYVPITDLKVVFGKVVSVHTGVLQPLGAKLAAQIAAEYGITDPAKVLRAQEIIDGEIYPALTAIKESLETFMADQRERVITAEEELAFEADEE